MLSKQRQFRLIYSRSLAYSLIKRVMLLFCLMPAGVVASAEIETVTLQLKYYHQFQFAGYYAALEKGFYKDAGLDVKLKANEPGLKSPIDEVLSGAAQYGVADNTLVIERLAGKPVVVLANIIQKSPAVWIVRKDSGISGLHDLVGKRVMHTPGLSSEMLAMLQVEGFPVSKINWIPSSFNIQDLIDGHTDAFNGYTVNEPYILREQGVAYRLINPRNYGIDFYGDVLFTSESEINDHPERAKAFRLASIKGWQYAMDHTDEIIKLINSKYASKKSLPHLKFEAEGTRDLILPDLITMGHTNPGRWRAIAERFVALGFTEANYDLLEGFIYNSHPKRLDLRKFYFITVSVALLALLFLGLVIRIGRLNTRLKKSERGLNDAQHVAHLGSWEWDITNNKISWSDELCRIYGLEPGEIEPSFEYFLSLLNEGTKIIVTDAVDKALAGKGEYKNEFPITLKNGEERIVSAKGIVIRDKDGKPVRMIGTTLDITERKQAEEELHKSEETNRAIIETSNDWIWSIDLDGKHIYSNPAVENILGYTSKELTGSDSIDLMHDDDKGRVMSYLNDSIRDQVGWSNLVIRWRHKDAGYRYLESNAVPSFNAENELVGFIGVDRDITERINFEKSLQESEEKYRLAMEATHDGLWDWDVTTGNVYYSPSWSNIVGEVNVEGNYSTWESRIHPDDKVRILRTIQTHFDGETESWEEEHRLRNAYEGWGWVLGRGSVVERDEKGNPLRMVGTMTDISERKRAEHEKELLQRELHESQKMDALGKLTGGIAHEYNNMLGIMIGFSELLTKSLNEQPKLFKYADEIRHAGNRAAKLTSKLLTFSQQKAPEAKSINLNTLLQKQQHMLEKTLTVRIKLVLNLQENPWQVWLDEGDMEDSIINISINAMHAIEGNGQLTIQTRNQNINQKDAKSLEITPGDYVLLSFTDTGCGIDNETKDKIFDPFFTTKGLEGTGLGLSMVYGFVQNSGGAVKVYSEQGEGTQFTLYFPRYLGASRDQLSEKENHSEAAFPGNKTILVVDDEPALRKLTHEILSTHGFSVFCAESTKEALNILQHESIDILISDIIMPEMDGYQLAATVKEKYPEVKIQLVSGFPDECSMGIADEHLQQNLLLKPFDSQELLLRIHELSNQK